mgnify:CR=1 FL=1
MSELYDIDGMGQLAFRDLRKTFTVHSKSNTLALQSTPEHLKKAIEQSQSLRVPQTKSLNPGDMMRRMKPMGIRQFPCAAKFLAPSLRMLWSILVRSWTSGKRKNCPVLAITSKIIPSSAKRIFPG